MTRLLDTNVLIALTWPNHTEHRKTRQWFRGVDSFATCPITQLGFCRISTHLKYAASPDDALAAIRAWIGHVNHEFWPDDVRMDDARLPKIRGHQQFTDAYLFALARKHCGKLASLDLGFRSLATAAPAHLELI
ncbi:MAG: PIN domain-containing protein [Verrucomicrobia bacterium]|nr:PIN domain-containing protein [Verrucomicrobiota bacterium]